MNKWQCKIAPSLGGGFDGIPESVWGTESYAYQGEPAIFFGLYGLPDFYALWRHSGRKAILWAGSDIKHFSNGYWLDDKGRIKIEPEALAQWINENCDNYVENGVEHEALMQFGIESKIVPSFLGKVEDYEISYFLSERPKVYLSVSGDNFEMYGWDVIERIAHRCAVEFHLYGNTGEWKSKHSNVYVHGRVPKEQMNQEIKGMQCGLRLNDFDGFSEILAKSVLWGQHPISRIGYQYIESFKDEDDLVKKLNELYKKNTPNNEARKYYKKNLNDYPWNENYKRS